MRLCAFWDCMEEVDEGISFCREHAKRLNSQLIDKCPKCGRYKDVRQNYCPDCNYGRPVAGWKIASRNLDDINEDQVIDIPVSKPEEVEESPVPSLGLTRSTSVFSRGEATCPSCGSPNLTYKKAFDYFKCNDCETTFITPVYSYGETNRWTGEPEQSGRKPESTTPFESIPREPAPPPPPITPEPRYNPPTPPVQPPPQAPVWKEPPPSYYQEHPFRQEPDYYNRGSQQPSPFDISPPQQSPQYRPPQPPPMPPARREPSRDQYRPEQSVSWNEPVGRNDQYYQHNQYEKYEQYDRFDEYVPPPQHRESRKVNFNFLKKPHFDDNGYSEKAIRAAAAGTASKTGWLYLLIVMAVMVLAAVLSWLLFNEAITDALSGLF